MKAIAKTIVDEKREQDIPYKKSGVQHFVNDLYKGTDRLNLDCRPIAGSDAFFTSYDYFGGNHQASKTNPSIGPYWRMSQFDEGLPEFLVEVRDERKQKIDEMNRENPGVNQERLLDKTARFAEFFAVESSR